MTLDGRTASLKAKEYLIEMHGPYGIWGFQVESVEYNLAGAAWRVECSFATSMLVTDRLRYEIIISEDDTINSVKKVG